MAQDIVDEAAAGDLVAYTEADRQFHLRLLAYDGNPRLVDLVSELRSQTRLLGLSGMLASGALAENAREHLLLVDLVEARDARRRRGPDARPHRPDPDDLGRAAGGPRAGTGPGVLRNVEEL